MSESHQQLIEKFYTAFQKKDAETMVACYHEDVIFEDPAFGELKGEDAKDMWRMLVESSDDGIVIRHHSVEANENSGAAKWEADYPFSKTGRMVYNKISAKFKFKDGLIIDHRDDFNFWKWTRMALGPAGFFLGYTGFMKKKVRSTAKDALAKYSAKRRNTK